MEKAGVICARKSLYLDRWVQLDLASGDVLSVSFLTQQNPAGNPDHELFGRIFAYLEGKRDEFLDVSVALTMPAGQRSVLETTREIPYGKQVSVERLARMTSALNSDSENGRNEVRIALDSNPMPLLIPDHRVRDGPSAAPPRVEQKLRALEGL